MVCQVFFEFRVKDDCIEKARNWLKKILPDTRAYNGCISISVTQDLDNLTIITVVELWESRQHFESYRDWRIESGVLSDVEEMLDGEPTWRFFKHFGV